LTGESRRKEIPMYGTVARIRVKPGKEAELGRLGNEMAPQIPGYVFHHVYQTDADPSECYLVVAFASKEAYLANANSPGQHARHQQYRALLDADPEWYDGEIVDSYPT
jgi:quinol monooxygenase YgiN